MKIRFYIILLLCLMLVPAAAFGQQSLSRDPNFRPPASGQSGVPPVRLPGPLPDGGFENGPPPTSLWTELTSAGCEWIMDPTAPWGMPAHSGTYVWWGGGYCGSPNTNSIQQTVAVPGDIDTLRFYLVGYRPDADDPSPDDFFQVLVNGNILLTRPLTQANDTYPNWIEVDLDVAAYAGQTVPVRFEVNTTGSSTGNVLIDDISWESNAPPIPALSGFALLALAIVLAVGGWLAVQRR